MTETEQKYVKQLETRLRVYEHAINEVDDYFEYRNESEQDKEYVRGILSRLTNRLKSAFK